MKTIQFSYYTDDNTPFVAGQYKRYYKCPWWNWQRSHVMVLKLPDEAKERQMPSFSL